ncbi:MAG: hypothetical protein EOM19_01540 [Candidatus Moranbacteria bacterium]|nr:hypothetical protein [Candidatus Moranbacteria bacterium]
MQISIKHTQFFFTLLISFFAITLSFLFSSKDIFQSILLSFCIFFIFPLLFIRFILKKSLKEFGFNSKISRYDIFWFFSLFFLASFVLFLCTFLFQIPKETLYPPSFIKESFWFFFLYFFIITGTFTFFYEFFFRGFIQIGSLRILQWKSVFFQWFLFLLFLWLTQTLHWENIFIIISSFFSGILIFKTKSLLLSFLFSWFFGILMSIIILNVF